MSAAIIQLEKDDNKFKMRIGGELIELPESVTDDISAAIEKVSPFCTSHTFIVRDIWEGKHFEDDEFTVDG